MYKLLYRIKYFSIPIFLDTRISRGISVTTAITLHIVNILLQLQFFLHKFSLSLHIKVSLQTQISLLKVTRFNRHIHDRSTTQIMIDRNCTEPVWFQTNNYMNFHWEKTQKENQWNEHIRKHLC